MVLATDDPTANVGVHGLENKRSLESDLLTSFLNYTETKELKCSLIDQKNIFRFSSGSLFTTHLALTS